MPSWSLSEPFCSTSWSMAVYLSSSPSCLTTCRLAAVLSIFGWFGTSHCSCRVQFSKARLVFEELMYWFVKTRGICSSTGLWRQYPLVEEFIYIDMFKSCTPRRHLWFRTLNVLFSCLCLSLVLSINSPNATSLHSRCIWEGVLEYNSQG